MNEAIILEGSDAAAGRAMSGLLCNMVVMLDGMHRVRIVTLETEVAGVELIDEPKVYGCNGAHYPRRVCRVSRLTKAAPAEQLELNV